MFISYTFYVTWEPSQRNEGLNKQQGLSVLMPGLLKNGKPWTDVIEQ